MWLAPNTLNSTAWVLQQSPAHVAAVRAPVPREREGRVERSRLTDPAHVAAVRVMNPSDRSLYSRSGTSRNWSLQGRAPFGGRRLGARRVRPDWVTDRLLGRGAATYHQATTPARAGCARADDRDSRPRAAGRVTEGDRVDGRGGLHEVSQDARGGRRAGRPAADGLRARGATTGQVRRAGRRDHRAAGRDGRIAQSLCPLDDPDLSDLEARHRAARRLGLVE